MFRMRQHSWLNASLEVEEEYFEGPWLCPSHPDVPFIEAGLGVTL